MSSFAQAQHLILKTDADYGRFVDPSIVGAARERAIKLLELMPPGMRGDFVEIHADGTVTSNRVDLPAFVKFRPEAKASTIHGARMATQLVPMSYPPTGGSGGPYIRLYSYQNINAAYGVATPPCDVSLDPSNHDTGNMYFNAYESNGSDLTDAGIGADEYPSRDGTASDVFSFVNSAVGGWDPSQVSGQYVNTYESWPCNQPLAIFYGTLPYPQYESSDTTSSGTPYGTSVLVVGTPDYDPTQWSTPPQTVTIQNPAWTFFDTPPGLDYQPSTYDGIASNCAYCSTAAMFTIAEPFADGSCYGMCRLSNGISAPDGDWRNMVMGELVSPCGPNTFGLSNPCTLEYDSSGNWYNNSDTCTNCAEQFGSADGTDQHIVEGIADLTYSGQSLSNNQIAVQALNLPTAPSYACTPDSDGYCAVEASRSATGSCNTGYPSPHGGYIYVTAYDTKYYIFKKSVMLELQEAATDYQSVSTDKPCYFTTRWSPNNPATYYNDPNLP